MLLWTNSSCIRCEPSIRTNGRPLLILHYIQRMICWYVHISQRASLFFKLFFEWILLIKLLFKLTAPVTTEHAYTQITQFTSQPILSKKKFPLILTLTCLMTESVFCVFFIQIKSNLFVNFFSFPGTITCKWMTQYICNHLIWFKYNLLSANWLVFFHIHEDT